MKKRIKIIYLFIILLVLSSCSSDNLELTEKIKAPDNTKPPLSGKWKIEDYKLVADSSLTEKAAKTYLGNEVLIDKKLVAVSSDYTLNPEFKVKNIKTQDYLWQFRVSPDFLNIDKDNLRIVTIELPGQFFYEFMAINNEKAIVYIDGGFFTLAKVSDKVEDGIISEYYYKDKEKESIRLIDNDRSVSKDTGVLIGLRRPANESENEEYKYRTLFFRFEKGKIKSSYVKENLFLPRKNGFWTVSAFQDENKSDKDNMIEEDIKLNRVSKEREILLRNNEKNFKKILYLGNDYISVEEIKYNEETDGDIRKLRVYTLEGINKEEPLSINDILKENGSKLFFEAMYKDNIIRNKKILIDEYNQVIDESNFGIFRKDGHWDLKGRVNYIEDEENIFRDFLVKAVIKDGVLSYDDINIPWAELKSISPEAVDIFEASNQEVVIVKTNSMLLIYKFGNGVMGELPIAKINLENDEEVVMLEWSEGKYSHNWDEEFLKTEFEMLEYSK